MISPHLGTAHLTDHAFVEAFETCQLPAAQFHHADHIRLAWIYLGRFSEEAATERIEQSIVRFAMHNGASQKYHRTITVAWMKLVSAARNEGAAASFQDFAELHPQLLDVKHLTHYYSAELLASPEARVAWLEPDIGHLP